MCTVIAQGRGLRPSSRCRFFTWSASVIGLSTTTEQATELPLSASCGTSTLTLPSRIGRVADALPQLAIELDLLLLGAGRHVAGVDLLRARQSRDQGRGEQRKEMSSAHRWVSLDQGGQPGHHVLDLLGVEHRATGIGGGDAAAGLRCGSTPASRCRGSHAGSRSAATAILLGFPARAAAGQRRTDVPALRRPLAAGLDRRQLMTQRTGGLPRMGEARTAGRVTGGRDRGRNRVADDPDSGRRRGRPPSGGRRRQPVRPTGPGPVRPAANTRRAPPPGPRAHRFGAPLPSSGGNPHARAVRTPAARALRRAGRRPGRIPCRGPEDPCRLS